MVETVERSFVTIDAIMLFSHRDEVSVIRFDGAGQLLRLDGNAVRIENPVRLEHRDDVESFFQTSFHERFRWIPRIPSAHKRDGVHPTKKASRSRVPLCFFPPSCRRGGRQRETPGCSMNHEPNKRMAPNRFFL